MDQTEPKELTAQLLSFRLETSQSAMDTTVQSDIPAKMESLESSQSAMDKMDNLELTAQLVLLS